MKKPVPAGTVFCCIINSFIFRRLTGLPSRALVELCARCVIANLRMVCHNVGKGGDPMKIGENIRLLRQRKGLTQE